jgi:hypothetical protein
MRISSTQHADPSPSSFILKSSNFECRQQAGFPNGPRATSVGGSSPRDWRVYASRRFVLNSCGLWPLIVVVMRRARLRLYVRSSGYAVASDL